MIQRKQTLFLFQLVFLGIALLFIPSVYVSTTTSTQGILLVPVNFEGLQSTPGHLFAIALNFLSLVLSFIAVFLYNRRVIQLRVCYALMAIWVVLTLMIAFCPFAAGTFTGTKVNYLAVLVGAFGIFAAYLAARYIKKDIELIKSADRIR